jgi:hypothetical protein
MPSGSYRPFERLSSWPKEGVHCCFQASSSISAMPLNMRRMIQHEPLPLTTRFRPLILDCPAENHWTRHSTQARHCNSRLLRSRAEAIVKTCTAVQGSPQGASWERHPNRYASTMDPASPDAWRSCRAWSIKCLRVSKGTQPTGLTRAAVLRTPKDTSASTLTSVTRRLSLHNAQQESERHQAASVPFL